MEGFVDAVMPRNENLFDFSEHMASYVRNYLQSYAKSCQGTIKESVSTDRHCAKNREIRSLHAVIRYLSQVPPDELAAERDFFERLSVVEQAAFQAILDGYSDGEIMDQCRFSPQKYRQILFSVWVKLAKCSENLRRRKRRRAGSCFNIFIFIK